MRPGTYRDREGNLVKVTRSPKGGFVLRYEDGRTVSIGGAK